MFRNLYSHAGPPRRPASSRTSRPAGARCRSSPRGRRLPRPRQPLTRAPAHARPQNRLQIRQWRRWEEEAPAAEAFLRVSNVPTTPRTPAAPAGAARGAWAHPDAAAKRARRSAKKLWARIGTNRFTHACHVALGVVTHDLVFSPVTRVVYYSLRLMFIDRLGLDYSFDFASFIERCEDLDFRL